MDSIDKATIQIFLERLGNHYQKPTSLFLLGGSALALLGSLRSTLDIDYVGNDLTQTPLQLAIDQVAHEMQVEVEPVPIAEFVPLPEGAENRNLFVGQYGNISVYIFDPYTIALTKIDRGFDTDIEDVIFLIKQNLITYKQLKQIIVTALEQNQEFDLIPMDIYAHLQIVANKL